MIPMVFAWIFRGRDICVWCERMSGCVLICFCFFVFRGKKNESPEGNPGVSLLFPGPLSHP